MQASPLPAMELSTTKDIIPVRPEEAVSQRRAYRSRSRTETLEINAHTMPQQPYPSMFSPDFSDVHLVWLVSMRLDAWWHHVHKLHSETMRRTTSPPHARGYGYMFIVTSLAPFREP